MTAPEPRWLSDEEQATWRSVVALFNLLPAQLERVLQQRHGLSLHDYEILVRLSETPDRRMRLSELAGLSQQSKSRLSHQMTRMEKAGLVRRESCPTDRRGAFAVMTDEGYARLVAAAPDHVESVRANLFDQIPADLVPALGKALEGVAAHLIGADAGATCPSLASDAGASTAAPARKRSATAGS